VIIFAAIFDFFRNKVPLFEGLATCGCYQKIDLEILRSEFWERGPPNQGLGGGGPQKSPKNPNFHLGRPWGQTLGVDRLEFGPGDAPRRVLSIGEIRTIFTQGVKKLCIKEKPKSAEIREKTKSGLAL
jgi:hypothetical protein